MIKKIELFNFKNIENQVINFDFNHIYFCGENGSGKTNILDAIYCLAFASSFLVNTDRELITYGKTEFYLKCFYETKGSDGEISLSFRNGKKEIKVNNSLIKDRKDLILNIPTIVFSNYDTDFIIGAPAKKRWFFDQAISFISLSYLDSLRKYRKILKQRNLILRQGDRDLLKVYNEIFVDYALEITKMRKNFIKHFYEFFKYYYSLIFDVSYNLEIKYLPSVKFCGRDEFLKTLFLKEKDELLNEVTLIGPHRDLYEILSGARVFTHHSSTGQIRALALIYRLVQVIIFNKRFGIAPILLFDDVFLELDSVRRKRVFDILPKDSQCFFTFLDDCYDIKQDNNFVVYRVKNGRFEL
ncbi:DNA replication/repair protein RecF [Borrelia anserina]|uniref:DNA replication and repair protein RecF n=2 Tax=Borrelia anserina TaxID=143 RepID=W5SP75_BORAN|nr:DNA replication and repair protein RecF [Borrelia anserina]AHH08413.1 DNA replication and repair protein recF [Borrelia anserina BA2]APR64895.1 DNA replication protein RecF [Borrelia anserina Es]UPA06817.1 DNA replication/repair protein RecF [Borrelia anserina]